jgi:membrane associated rhomboid family serine protease
MNRSSIFGNTPPLVMNIIIINVIMLLTTMVLSSQFGIDLENYMALHYYKSSLFKPYQIITYMFMHANFMHLFLNMYALWMFGQVLELDWGSKRFLIYYTITGIGAVVVQTFVNYIHFSIVQSAIEAFSNSPSPDLFVAIVNKHFSFLGKVKPDFIADWAAHLNDPGYSQAAITGLNEMYGKMINIPTVGASGAVFGVLLAFGMLHPNTELYLMFLPIPIKAKWFVVGYGAVELVWGIAQPGSQIAHFAHLGGMLFGFLLIKYWQANRKTFY